MDGKLHMPHLDYSESTGSRQNSSKGWGGPLALPWLG